MNAEIRRQIPQLSTILLFEESESKKKNSLKKIGGHSSIIDYVYLLTYKGYEQFKSEKHFTNKKVVLGTNS